MKYRAYIYISIFIVAAVLIMTYIFTSPELELGSVIFMLLLCVHFVLTLLGSLIKNKYFNLIVCILTAFVLYYYVYYYIESL